MVDADIYHCSDDAGLDIPGLPHADHRASRRHPKCQTGAVSIPAHYHRRDDHPRSWLPGFLDGVFGVYLSTHVAETAQGEHATWYVRFGWTQRLHRGGNSEYGGTGKKVIPGIFHGQRSHGCGYFEGSGQFRCFVVMGVSASTPFFIIRGLTVVAWRSSSSLSQASRTGRLLERADWYSR